MRAMILAAGRGNRMRPLSDHTPKPLLKVNEKSLIEYHLENLARANIREVIINLGHLGKKIEEALGDGDRWSLRIHYSYEDPVLETGGGIIKVLNKLGQDPFLVLSGDIYTDYPFAKLPSSPKGLAHLVLTDNPPHHPQGDFALIDNEIYEMGAPRLNFAGIGIYRPELFSDCPLGPVPLSTFFKKAIKLRAITGEYYKGLWHNIGTPEQLTFLNQSFSKNS